MPIPTDARPRDQSPCSLKFLRSEDCMPELLALTETSIKPPDRVLCRFRISTFSKFLKSGSLNTEKKNDVSNSIYSFQVFPHSDTQLTLIWSFPEIRVQGS